MSLASCGEFGLIARIRAQAQAGEDVLLGIGDDCCALQLPPGEVLLTSTDLLLEGVHFRRDWTDLFTLGRKCVAVNISDIAAMGGTPRYLSLGLGLPADLAETEFDALISGILSGAGEYGALLTGGDTCRSLGGLILSLTVQGHARPERIIRRSGARPGDLLYVSGTLGESGLALRELLAGRRPAAELARRHHDPTARLALGRELAARQLATAMIDLSDGLLADLGHLLQASGVGARIETERLPLSPLFRCYLEKEPALLELALAGGEDYELLWSAPPQAGSELTALAEALALPLTCIGTMVATPGLTVNGADGRPLRLERSGFNHFAPAGDGE